MGGNYPNLLNSHAGNRSNTLECTQVLILNPANAKYKHHLKFRLYQGDPPGPQIAQISILRRKYQKNLVNQSDLKNEPPSRLHQVWQTNHYDVYAEKL